MWVQNGLPTDQVLRTTGWSWLRTVSHWTSFRMSHIRSEEAMIKVALDRCLILELRASSPVVFSFSNIHWWADTSVFSTRARTDNVLPIPISSANIPPPVSVGWRWTIKVKRIYKLSNKEVSLIACVTEWQCLGLVSIRAIVLCEHVPRNTVNFDSLPKLIFLRNRSIFTLHHEIEGFFLMSTHFSEVVQCTEAVEILRIGKLTQGGGWSSIHQPLPLASRDCVSATRIHRWWCSLELVLWAFQAGSPQKRW